MTVYWRASDDPNGTPLRAETWAVAAGERSWKNVGPQLKPWRGWRLCARWRAWLRFPCVLEAESATKLDNESKERALVGEVISTVALAGQICREFNVSDHGIDMEIEFKGDDGEATGCRLFLQLKSGDSYLRERTSDGVEIFTIQKERHVRYWMAQAF